MTFDIDLLAGKANYTRDFLFQNTAPSSDGRFDVLIFADSRGFALEKPDSSWTVKLFESAQAMGLSALLVVRPRDLTGLFTLHNFLELSQYRFRFAVCQVGLAEFTPKPDDAMRDLALQMDVGFPGIVAERQPLGRTLVMRPGVDGAETTAAYEQTYVVNINTPGFRFGLVSLFERHFSYALLLGAVELSESAKTARVRPSAFYEQVRASNRYLCELAARSRAIHFVEPLKGWKTDSASVLHDGAHYTEDSHAQVFAIARTIVMANAVGG